MDDEVQTTATDEVESGSGNDEALRVALDQQVEANRDLLERLRRALLATEPAIDPELVRGGTVEEVEASFEAAKRTVSGIREAVRQEQQRAIPIGAPGRAASGPRSAYDKIRAGLSRLS